ncbi:MAG: energy transducer TonB [Bacteroidales bacterium]|nr:energy transducer TonB [Bacteroidales bacterium]
MKNKKDKIKAGAATVLVHLLLALLLAFLTLSVAEPDKQDEDGVPVLLGQVEDAAGEDLSGLPASDEDVPEMEESAEEPVEETTPEMPIPEPAPVPEPKPEAEPLITQDTERSIAAQRAAEEAVRKKAAEEAARRAAEEAARKKAAEEAAKRAAANNRVAGAFGSAGNKGSSGNSTGNGNQGSPDGNSNAGTASGKGGSGVTANVGNREPSFLPEPDKSAVTSETEGTIVVGITVTPEGYVINPWIKSSTTASPELKKAAIEAAKKSRFKVGSTTDKGTTTYKFKAK